MAATNMNLLSPGSEPKVQSSECCRAMLPLKAPGQLLSLPLPSFWWRQQSLAMLGLQLHHPLLCHRAFLHLCASDPLMVEGPASPYDLILTGHLKLGSSQIQCHSRWFLVC